MSRTTHQRGVGLVELLVGSTLGLLILGGASSLFLGQAKGHHRLHLNQRLQQEARALAQALTQEIRRAGSGLQAQESLESVVSAEVAPSGTLLTLRHRPDAGSSVVTREIRWQDKSLAWRSGTSGFQPLSDGSVLQVDQARFELMAHETALPDPSTRCPEMVLRDNALRVDLQLSLKGEPESLLPLTLSLPLPPQLVSGEGCP